MAKGDVIPRPGKHVDPMERIAIALEKILETLTKKPVLAPRPKS